MKPANAEIMAEFKHRVQSEFPDAEIILFGSTARGDASADSDIDLLVVLDREVNTPIEDRIYDLAYELDLQFDVVLGVLVEPRSFWDSDLARAMPLHVNIDREGIKL